MKGDLFRRRMMRVDQLMWLPIGLITLLCLIVGVWSGTLLIVVLYAAVTTPVALVVQRRYKGRSVNGFLKAAIMMGWSAVLIEQSDGLIEAHFSIFILLSTLILYSNWRVIALGGAVIALHHALFTWLQYHGWVQLYSGMGGNHDNHHGVSELVACFLMHGGAVVAHVCVLGCLAWQLSRMVAEGLHVSHFAHEAGKGKLNTEFTTKHAELPAVAAIIEMRDQVAASLRYTQHAASGVSNYSAQLFKAQEQLREQASRNTVQTEHISASTEQLTRTTLDTAESSRHVRHLTGSAQQTVRHNGEQVDAMREMMQTLQTHASHIAAMLGEIDHITFQTNLLALNASVEAARAGEHGRGFAVVASEVRQLASNTQQTAGRIHDAVKAITSVVQQGAQQTQQVGETTHDLMTTFEQVAERLLIMDSAVQEQQQGIEKLELSVSEMHSALALSHQAVGEAYNMSELLSTTASSMRDAVERFQLPRNVSPIAEQAALVHQAP